MHLSGKLPLEFHAGVGLKGGIDPFLGCCWPDRHSWGDSHHPATNLADLGPSYVSLEQDECCQLISSSPLVRASNKNMSENTSNPVQSTGDCNHTAGFPEKRSQSLR